MKVRSKRVYAMVKMDDGSIWGDIGEEAIFGCEVCNTKPAFRWECLQGKWQGVRAVACCQSHAVKAIGVFINYGKKREASIEGHTG